MLTEIDKVKKDVRAVKSDKNANRVVSNSMNDEFQKRAMGSIKFVEDNISKLKSLLLGERDQCPSDLG